MKHIAFIICCLLSLTACGDKQENNKTTNNPETSISTTEQPKLNISIDGTLYSFEKDKLTEKCISTNEITCAIETTIKCALLPTASYCNPKTMPDFIFYDDAMFADDNGLGRPTQQSFKITKIKQLSPNKIEVFTEGDCDKNWFGNCKGNIIYILEHTNNQWNVKELYALESI